MGFKINKGKSWKNLGKKTGKGTKDFFTKDNGKSDFIKDAGKSIDKSADKTFSKKNMDSLGDGAKKTFSEKSIKKVGGDAKKTFNAASKGLGKVVEGVQGSMTTWLMIGGAAFVAVMVITSPSSSSSKSYD